MSFSLFAVAFSIFFQNLYLLNYSPSLKKIRWPGIPFGPAACKKEANAG